MKILTSTIGAIGCLISAPALAGTYTVTEGQDVAVGISAKGALVTLPTFVRYVQEPLNFVLTEIPVNAADGKNAVKSFQIRPRTANPLPEKITFVLANEKRVGLMLTPMANGDDYIDLKFPPQSGRKGDIPQGTFMRDEMALMLTMLRDENVSNRRVLNEKASLAEYPDLDFKLVRDFRSDGLTGLVFIVTNKGKSTLKVNPTVLQFGRPNRGMMIQMDHEVLEPCSVDNSSHPRGRGCVSAMRLVLRGTDFQKVPQMYSNPRAGQGPLVVAERSAQK
jgi:hypothetical protein